MKNTSYYLAAISAFCIWGFFSFVLRPLAGYPSLDILFYRVFLSAVLMLIVSLGLRPHTWKVNKQLFSGLPRNQKRGLVLQILGGGFFLTCNWYSFIYVMNHVSLNAGAFAYVVCPILTTVLAFFILKEQLKRWQWAAIGGSATGCLLLSFNHLADLLYSLIIALSYALYLVSQRKNYGVDKFLLLTLQVAFSALLLLPFYPVFSGAVPQASLFYILISVIAVCFTIFPLLLNLYALKRLKSSTVGVLLYINPLLGFVIAVVCYGEKIDFQQAIAYAVIGLSVILFNLRFADRPGRVTAE
jgi:chloramphenicol-sensitive protein RarD